MRKTLIFTVCAIALSQFLIQPAVQSGQNLGSGAGLTRLYRSGTIEYINGDVEAVQNLVPTNLNHEWQIVILDSNKSSISIYVAPMWYLNSQNFSIEEDDFIKVKGSRVLIDGSAAIIAGEIWVGNDFLKLRNKIGIPVWQGDGRN
jgi:hypothetical protein